MRGGCIDFKTFVYPILSNSYKIENLQVALPDFTASWFGETLFFLLFFVFSLLKIVKDNNSRNIYCCYVVFAILGLGVQSYYINRAVQGNLMISYLLFIFLLSALLDRIYLIRAEYICIGHFVKFPKLDLTLGIKFASLICVCTLILGNVGIDNVFKSRIDGAWYTRDLNKLVRSIDKKLPKNTVGFGIGVPELYAIMDRDTILYIIDWADILTDPNLYYPTVSKSISKLPYFFANISSLNSEVSGVNASGGIMLSGIDDFVLNEEFTINGNKFGFFVRK